MEKSVFQDVKSGTKFSSKREEFLFKEKQYNIFKQQDKNLYDILNKLTESLEAIGLTGANRCLSPEKIMQPSIHPESIGKNIGKSIGIQVAKELIELCDKKIITGYKGVENDEDIKKALNNIRKGLIDFKEKIVHFDSKKEITREIRSVLDDIEYDSLPIRSKVFGDKEAEKFLKTSKDEEELLHEKLRYGLEKIDLEKKQKELKEKVEGLVNEEEKLKKELDENKTQDSIIKSETKVEIGKLTEQQEAFKLRLKKLKNEQIIMEKDYTEAQNALNAFKAKQKETEKEKNTGVRLIFSKIISNLTSFVSKDLGKLETKRKETLDAKLQKEDEVEQEESGLEDIQQKIDRKFREKEMMGKKSEKNIHITSEKLAEKAKEILSVMEEQKKIEEKVFEKTEAIKSVEEKRQEKERLLNSLECAHESFEDFISSQKAKNSSLQI
jgi:hypothetical protein